jgi:hypothetical protein
MYAMATITTTPDTLSVRFTRAEKVAGLLRDIDVPLAKIRAVVVESDGLRAARGTRAPGLALPGRRKIGTWRRPGHRTAVAVRAGEPAVRITLHDHKYSALLIGTPTAAQVAGQLRAAAHPSGG